MLKFVSENAQSLSDRVLGRVSHNVATLNHLLIGLKKQKTAA